jgi:hypothetical protein
MGDDQQDRGALQELEETLYWHGLVVGADVVKAERVSDLMNEANELIAILVTSAKTLKARKSNEKRSDEMRSEDNRFFIIHHSESSFLIGTID